MGEPKKGNRSAAYEPPVASRRHDPVSELRVVAARRYAGVETSDELRASLWGVIYAFLFAPHDGPAVQRLWSSPPLSGDPAQLPEDVAELIGSWFRLVEPHDALALVESAHESLDPPLRARFAEACNDAFVRAGLGRRFVGGRLVPVATVFDLAAG